jgi:hypothetical protein
MLARVVEEGDAIAAFAVAKLETLVLDQAKFKINQAGGDGPAPVAIESPAQAAELLEGALARKMGALLSAPGSIDLKTIKDLRECLNLLTEMRGQAQEAEGPARGLSPDADAKIRSLLEGGL